MIVEKDTLGQEYNKENKEKYKNSENFYHEPTIWCDGLEVPQNFTVSSFNIQFCILDIGIDPEGQRIILLWNLDGTQIFFKHTPKKTSPLNHFFLFFYHRCKLLEDST